MATIMTECKTRREAERMYPAAVKIVRVTGGWMVHETWTDYQTWRRQT